jgi:hypothetical protein
VSPGFNSGMDMALAAKCDILTREREAVQTIMELKIKVLVQSVANALQAVLLGAPSGGGQAGDALSKDVSALLRLVNASIAALKNASTPSTSPKNGTTPTVSPMNGTAGRGSGGGFKEQGNSRDGYDKRDYNRESRDNISNIVAGANSSQNIPNNLSRDYANFLNNSKENSTKNGNDNHGNSVINTYPDSRVSGYPDDSHSNGKYLCMINTLH